MLLVAAMIVSIMAFSVLLILLLFNFKNSYPDIYLLFIQNLFNSIILEIILRTIIYITIMAFIIRLLFHSQNSISIIKGIVTGFMVKISVIYVTVNVLVVNLYSVYSEVELLADFGMWFLGGTLLITTVLFLLLIIPFIKIQFLVRNKVFKVDNDNTDRLHSGYLYGILYSVVFFSSLQILPALAGYNLPYPLFGIFVTGYSKSIFISLLLLLMMWGLILVRRNNFLGWFLILFTVITHSGSVLFTYFGSLYYLLDTYLIALGIQIPGFSISSLTIDLPFNFLFLYQLLHLLSMIILMFFSLGLFSGKVDSGIIIKQKY
jgi:hypothetical protein